MDAPVGLGHLPGAGDAAQLLRHRQPRLEPVLVEAMAEVGPAEPGPPRPLEVPQQPLGSDGVAVIDRVLVEEAAVDGPLGRALGGIEGDEQGQVAGQVLEPVHPIADADSLLVAPTLR